MLLALKGSSTSPSGGNLVDGLPPSSSVVLDLLEANKSLGISEIVSDRVL